MKKIFLISITPTNQNVTKKDIFSYKLKKYDYSICPLQKEVKELKTKIQKILRI